MESTVLLRPIKEGPRNYFKTHKKILKCFGLSFTGNETIAYKLYSFLILSSTIFAYNTLEIYVLLKSDAETASGFISYVSASVATVIKVSVTYVNRIKIGNLLAKLEQKPFLPNPKRGGDEEEKLIQECMWKVNVQSYAVWIGTAATILSADIYALWTRLKSTDYHDWKLSFGPVAALNVTYSPNYEISLAYQCVSVGIFGVHFVTTDIIIASVLLHIRCQFKILQHFLKHIVEHSYGEMLQDINNIPSTSTTELNSNYEMDGSIIPYKYLQKSLKKAVRHHIAILDVAKEMEELFRYLLLLGLLVNLIYYCFEIYQASSQNTAFGLLRYAGEFLDIVLTLLLLCYWGEQIVIESQQVGDAAYQANFVGTDVRFQKSLVLIMRRSQESTKLTAGKFTDICLATFVWVMKTSYSSFMLIRNLKGNEI